MYRAGESRSEVGRREGCQYRMDRWRGRTAVVTGGSSGIGELLVRRLAGAGLRVLALARRADRLQALEAELLEAGLEVKCLECDVTEDFSVRSAFTWLEENWGAVDILVNNAGVFPFSKATDENFLEQTKLAIGVNVLGLTACTSLAVQSMLGHSVRDGHIININSVAGHRLIEVDGFIPYTASKHAVSVISSQLRSELARSAPGIRVTDLSPGLTRSEIADQFAGLFGPAKSILETEDVVDAIIYCLAAPPHVNISQLTIQPLAAQIIRANGVNGHSQN